MGPVVLTNVPDLDEAPDLELRRRPTQARALATFELILDTTASLLETHGFDALTTNLISVESGVSVRAIYRYFPNKHAVVGELARRMEQQWGAALDAAGDFDDPSSPWREVWNAYIDTFVDAVRSTNGGRAVLNAMRGDPELRKADDEANAIYISNVASVLRSRAATVSPGQATAVATVLIRSTVAVLDEAFEANGAVATQLITVMKQMHAGLLGEYLD